ncbi:hypothetical protein Q5752_004320 [Cryptotrichosporon argae]
MTRYALLLALPLSLAAQRTVPHAPELPVPIPSRKALPPPTPVPTLSEPMFTTVGSVASAAARTLSPAQPTPSASAGAGALVARCDGGCTGATEVTLQASVVTTTIESITTVPCYVTSFVTNSETVLSTVYATETVVVTQTIDDTVYVIRYSPTPVLESSAYETVLQVTETAWTYWTAEEGGASELTSTALATTVGGTTEVAATVTGTPMVVVGTATTASADAWTHVSEADDEIATTTSEDGWATATTDDDDADGSTVVWSAGERARDAELVVVVATAVGLVVAWELSRFL